MLVKSGIGGGRACVRGAVEEVHECQGAHGLAWPGAGGCERHMHRDSVGGWVSGLSSQTLVLLRRASSPPPR
eukprot:10415525-Prorocentrum_lima.AAC.1